MMNKLSHRAALAALLVFGLSTSAFAASPPSAGLGQAWPNTVDVSSSPQWHAYVFMLGGIKYVQINDINGNVLGAVGTASGQFITLPIGRFSQLVATPQQPAATPATAAAAASPSTVYKDSTIQITATRLTNGAVQLNAMSTTAACDPIECNNGGAIHLQTVKSAAACDPIECNNGGAVHSQSAKRAVACDPIECNNGGAVHKQAAKSALACDPIECNNGIIK